MMANKDVFKDGLKLIPLFCSLSSKDIHWSPFIDITKIESGKKINVQTLR